MALGECRPGCGHKDTSLSPTGIWGSSRSHGPAREHITETWAWASPPSLSLSVNQKGLPPPNSQALHHSPKVTQLHKVTRQAPGLPSGNFGASRGFMCGELRPWGAGLQKPLSWHAVGSSWRTTQNSPREPGTGGLHAREALTSET